MCSRICRCLLNVCFCFTTGRLPVFNRWLLCLLDCELSPCLVLDRVRGSRCLCASDPAPRGIALLLLVCQSLRSSSPCTASHRRLCGAHWSRAHGRQPLCPKLGCHDPNSSPIQSGRPGLLHLATLCLEDALQSIVLHLGRIESVFVARISRNRCVHHCRPVFGLRPLSCSLLPSCARIRCQRS